MSIPKTLTTLSKIRSNRRELRKRGVTPAGLLVLEACAYRCGDGMARVSVAALGRMVGVSRSAALRQVQRLEALGALVRIGSAIMLNVRGVLSWCTSAALARVEHVKRLYLRKKQAAAARVFGGGVAPAAGSTPVPVPLPVPSSQSRQEALAELAASYVPVHLRQSR